MKYVSGSSSLCRAPSLHCAVLLGACIVLLAGASAREALAAQVVRPPIRSAQLFEQDGRWASVSPRSTQEERAEIRTHFAAVRGILRQRSSISLAIAAARFEDVFSLSLTPERRAELIRRLAARRELQLERLLDYAREGRFPLNRHYAGEARPIFVDALGTHCAVGHLMALDGWEVEVNAIARTTPNVLVREVDDGPLIAWLLTSGLTREEAALIQPGYFPPSNDVTSLTALIVPGVSLDRNGFRYENFAFSASSTGGAATLTAAQFGLAYGWPPLATGSNFCTGYSAACIPRPDTLWIGAYTPPSSFGLFLAGANQTISFDIEYDVVALAAGRAIGGTQTSTSLYYGGIDTAGGTASLATTLDGDPLRMLVLNFPPSTAAASESTLFDEPADRLHVRHAVHLANGSYFTAFNSTILQAVPVPGTAGLLALSLTILGRLRRRSGSTMQSAPQAAPRAVHMPLAP